MALKALGVDAIGLYQFHRPDPNVPYEGSIGAIKELLDAGKIRMAGIPNATVEQIDIARRVLATAIWPACRTSSRQRSGPVSPTAARRGPRHRVPTLEPARRHRQGRRTGRPARRVPRRRPRARRVPAAGNAGLAARARTEHRADTRREPPRVDHRLGQATELEFTVDDVARLSAA